MGDFNLPTIKWGSDIMCHGLAVVDRQFYNCFTTLGLVQWIYLPTFVPSGNILDLILTSEHDKIGATEVLPPFPGCGHCPIL